MAYHRVLAAAGGFESVLLLAAALPLLAVAVMPRAAPAARPGRRHGGLLHATVRPGVGLMLVNVGYAALLAFGGGRSPLVVPLFAATVIAARTPGAGIPDRVGARRTLAVAALGLLALSRIPPQRHGAAAGLFFSWFDAGVGLGGPAAGVLAHLGGPTGALLGAAIAVAAAGSIPVFRPSGQTPGRW